MSPDLDSNTVDHSYICISVEEAKLRLCIFLPVSIVTFDTRSHCWSWPAVKNEKVSYSKLIFLQKDLKHAKCNNVDGLAQENKASIGGVPISGVWFCQPSFRNTLHIIKIKTVSVAQGSPGVISSSQKGSLKPLSKDRLSLKNWSVKLTYFFSPFFIQIFVMMSKYSLHCWELPWS